MLLGQDFSFFLHFLSLLVSLFQSSRHYLEIFCTVQPYFRRAIDSQSSLCISMNLLQFQTAPIQFMLSLSMVKCLCYKVSFSSVGGNYLHGNHPVGCFGSHNTVFFLLNSSEDFNANWKFSL